MKYKLLLTIDDSTHAVTCACGRCEPAVYIDEDSKEEFKMMMEWDEDEFIKRTVVVQER